LTFVLAVVFSGLGSIGAILGAAGVLLAHERLRVLLTILVSYATGTLLASSFLGLLPEALELRQGKAVPATIVVGILAFFVLEKLVLWRHSHDTVVNERTASGELILIGDFFHNLVDGVIIGGAFATEPALGVTTSVAVIAHEVPQEVGDFAILLDSGFGRAKAFLYNLASASSTIPAAAIAYAALNDIESGIPFVLAIAAASFIYIALADLVPRLHEKAAISDLPAQLVPILAGVGTIVLVGVVT
jgi:zinc and cadmium transporter